MDQRRATLGSVSLVWACRQQSASSRRSIRPAARGENEKSVATAWLYLEKSEKGEISVHIIKPRHYSVVKNTATASINILYET